VTIKLLNLESFSKSDRYILTEGKYERNVIYVLDSTPPRYYMYYRSQQMAENKVLLTRNLEIAGVTESEFEIFLMRMQTYRESLEVAELRVVYPSVTEEQIDHALRRAIKRMHLLDPNESILLSLVNGVTKQQLMEEYHFTFEQINSAVINLQNNIQYYCFSEYEKKYLCDRVNGLTKGTVKFLYTNTMFAKQYGIPETLLSGIIDNVVMSNPNLTDDEKNFVRHYMNYRDSRFSSSEENEQAYSIIEKIIHDYCAAKEKFFEELVETARKNNPKFNMDDISLPEEYGCQIIEACRRLGIRRLPRPNRPKVVLDRRKRLKDYLDD